MGWTCNPNRKILVAYIALAGKSHGRQALGTLT
jgi:hypothetical protein